MDSMPISVLQPWQKYLRRYGSFILVGVILLLAFGFWFNTRLQASRFVNQLQSIVTQAGLSMDNVEIRNQQITLSGEIENQRTRTKLLDDLQALPDIQTVVDGLTLKRTASPILSMRGFAGSLSVQGTLPDAESVEYIVGLLNKRFDNIDNQLQADPNTLAPEWLGRFEKLAPELAALEPLTFSIDGNKIRVEGIARDRSKRDSISLALYTVFGDQYKVDYQVSLPTPSESARLVLKRDGVDVVLQGVLPNQAMVDQIVKAVQDNFPAAQIRFELALNSDVSEPGWITQAATIIESLSAADPAGLEMTNQFVVLDGSIKSEQIKNHLETLVTNAFSEPIDIDNQLIVVAPSKQAEFDLSVQGGLAVLTGVVPDKTVERDLLAVNDTVFGPDKVTNRLVVADDVAEPEWLGQTIKKIQGLKNVKNMHLTANQEGVNVSELTIFTIEELTAQTQTSPDNVRIVESGGLEGSSAGANKNTTAMEQTETVAAVDTGVDDAVALSSADARRLRDSLANIDVSKIQFAPNSSQLTPESKATLDSLDTLLQEFKSAVIEVGGHTDSQGSEEYNLELSQQRANSVVRYLVEKGTQATQLKAKGYGESKPIADNAAESGRAANRRIELALLN